MPEGVLELFQCASFLDRLTDGLYHLTYKLKALANWNKVLQRIEYISLQFVLLFICVCVDSIMSSNSPNSGGGGRQKKQDHQTAAVSSPVAQADADTARKIHSNGTSTKTNNSNANKQKPQKSAGGGGGKKKGGKNANNKATGTGAGGADTPGASDKKKKTPPSAKPNQSGTKGGKGKTPPPPPSAAVSNGKQQQEEVMIHMDGEAADSVNYAVLKRIEPTLKGIIARASFSVIYVYSQESESWVCTHASVFYAEHSYKVITVVWCCRRGKTSKEHALLLKGMTFIYCELVFPSTCQ